MAPTGMRNRMPIDTSASSSTAPPPGQYAPALRTTQGITKQASQQQQHRRLVSLDKKKGSDLDVPGGMSAISALPSTNVSTSPSRAAVPPPGQRRSSADMLSRRTSADMLSRRKSADMHPTTSSSSSGAHHLKRSASSVSLSRFGGGGGVGRPRGGRTLALLFLILLALGLILYASSASTAAGEQERAALRDMAARIAELSEEVGDVNARARTLEEEGRKMEEELERERDEVRRMRSEEAREREEMRKKDEEVRKLLAEVAGGGKEPKNKSEERGSEGGNLRGAGDSNRAADSDADASLLRDRLAEMRRSIQERDRAEVLRKFGSGPYHVRIELEFPPGAPPPAEPVTRGAGGDGGDDGKGTNADAAADSFVLEMAPLSLMPHTVRFFLEQVDAGLWDGCHFYRNAGHVIQATPKTQASDLEPPFVDRGLLHVSFQEYSPDYPHHRYTVGLGGRPAGPMFYINKKENVKRHGPGGQRDTYKEAGKEADPCFGRVVSGFETVERLGRMPLDETQSNQRMRDYVMIVSAKVVHPKGGGSRL